MGFYHGIPLGFLRISQSVAHDGFQLSAILLPQPCRNEVPTKFSSVYTMVTWPASSIFTSSLHFIPSLIILLKRHIDSHLMLFILQSLTRGAYSDHHWWIWFEIAPGIVVYIWWLFIICLLMCIRFLKLLLPPPFLPTCYRAMAPSTRKWVESFRLYLMTDMA